MFPLKIALIIRENSFFFVLSNLEIMKVLLRIVPLIYMNVYMQVVHGIKLFDFMISP